VELAESVKGTASSSSVASMEGLGGGAVGSLFLRRKLLA